MTLSISKTRRVKHSFEIAFLIFVRDMISTNRRSFTGYFWIFASPLIASSVWILMAKSKVITTELSPSSYIIYLYSGQILWQLFLDNVLGVSKCLLSLKPIFSKIPIQPEVLLFLPFIKSIFNFSLKLFILVIFLLFAQHEVTVVQFLSFLLYSLFVGVLFCSIGGVLAPFSVLVGDVSKALELGAKFFYFLVPVFYFPNTGLLKEIYHYNFLAKLIVLPRTFMTQESQSQMYHLLFFLGVVSSLGAFKVLKRSIPILNERL